MHPNFRRVLDELYPRFEHLVGMEPIRAKSLPIRKRLRGVYLFSERGHHLYVGRSNNIRGRYGRHCNPGATHHMATFAFRLARKTTGKLKASYKSGENSRKGLLLSPDFLAAFNHAKARIRKMKFRFVEEPNPKRQALLEIYCAIALATPYNDFDTH